MKLKKKINEKAITHVATTFTNNILNKSIANQNQNQTKPNQSKNTNGP